MIYMYIGLLNLETKGLLNLKTLQERTQGEGQRGPDTPWAADFRKYLRFAPR